MAERYVVAFEYTKEAGGYRGVVTWSSFASKAEFDAWYTEDIHKCQCVVEEGITPERAVELVRQTPVVCRMFAAFEKARDSKTGEINDQILEMELANVLYLYATRM